MSSSQLPIRLDALPEAECSWYQTTRVQAHAKKGFALSTCGFAGAALVSGFYLQAFSLVVLCTAVGGAVSLLVTIALMLYARPSPNDPDLRMLKRKEGIEYMQKPESTVWGLKEKCNATHITEEEVRQWISSEISSLSLETIIRRFGEKFYLKLNAEDKPKCIQAVQDYFEHQYLAPKLVNINDLTRRYFEEMLNCFAKEENGGVEILSYLEKANQEYLLLQDAKIKILKKKESAIQSFEEKKKHILSPLQDVVKQLDEEVQSLSQKQNRKQLENQHDINETLKLHEQNERRKCSLATSKENLVGYMQALERDCKINNLVETAKKAFETENSKLQEKMTELKSQTPWLEKRLQQYQQASQKLKELREQKEGVEVNFKRQKELYKQQDELTDKLRRTSVVSAADQKQLDSIGEELATIQNSPFDKLSIDSKIQMQELQIQAAKRSIDSLKARYKINEIEEKVAALQKEYEHLNNQLIQYNKTQSLKEQTEANITQLEKEIEAYQNERGLKDSDVLSQCTKELEDIAAEKAEKEKQLTQAQEKLNEQEAQLNQEEQNIKMENDRQVILKEEDFSAWKKQFTISPLLLSV